MLFSLYFIAENIIKLPQMPWITVRNIVMTWSHHNPKLELFLVLKEYLHLSENLALSQQFIQINKVNQVKHFNQHFKDHPYHESTCTPNAIRKTRTFCKHWPNIITALPHFLSCFRWLNSLNQHSHSYSTIGLQTFYNRSTHKQIHTFRGLEGYNEAKV